LKKPLKRGKDSVKCQVLGVKLEQNPETGDVIEQIRHRVDKTAKSEA
jgi:hypothetical protein